MLVPGTGPRPSLGKRVRPFPLYLGGLRPAPLSILPVYTTLQRLPHGVVDIYLILPLPKMYLVYVPLVNSGNDGVVASFFRLSDLGSFT